MSTLQTQYQNYLNDEVKPKLTFDEWVGRKFSDIPKKINKIKKIKNMENLYNYVLWYNSYNETWYGIPTEKYVDFKTGKSVDEIDGLKTSTNVNDLISLISE